MRKLALDRISAYAILATRLARLVTAPGAQQFIFPILYRIGNARDWWPYRSADIRLRLGRAGTAVGPRLNAMPKSHSREVWSSYSL